MASWVLPGGPRHDAVMVRAGPEGRGRHDSTAVGYWIENGAEGAGVTTPLPFTAG
jgi:hypothetical protein